MKKNYSEDLYIEFTIEYKNLATPYALLFGRGPDSAHFEKESVTVMMNLLPPGVSVSGPIRSIPIWCHNLS